MARANVPKFGNWENEGNVPYTVFFDKARKQKGGKMINPNDPQENPDMFAPSSPPPTRSTPTRFGNKQEEPNRRGSIRQVPDHRRSREEGDFKQFANSPARSEMGQISANESNYGGRGQRPGQSTRPSVGSDQSFERSPLHPHYQAKVTGRETGSAAWDGKNHDSSHGTGLKSRLRPAARGNESPDNGAAVPRFGAWDESNPESAENFTHIFNIVRKERNTAGAAGNMPGTPKDSSYGPRSQQPYQPKVRLSNSASSIPKKPLYFALIYQKHVNLRKYQIHPLTSGFCQYSEIHSNSVALVLVFSFDAEKLSLFLVELEDF